VRSVWETSARNPSVSFCNRPLKFGHPVCAQFSVPNFSVTSSWIVVLHTWERCNATLCTSHLAGHLIGAVISNTSHSIQPVLTLSNEHGSQVKDQGRRQCCHNKHKNFLVGLHVMYLYFPDTLLSIRLCNLRVYHIKTIWDIFVLDVFQQITLTGAY
jgi:hypothetical protein